MSYIGTKTGGHVFRSNAFNSVRYTGDGTTTQYNLPETVVDDDAVLIHIDGVKQHSPAAYSTSGATLTFTGAPPSASAIEIILFGIGEVNIHTPTTNSVGVSALKTSDGTAGQVLTTDGAGALSFSSKSTETLSSMGVTSTAAELNILDGVTATAAELNYTDGVTSAIQTQIDTKLPKAGGTMTGTIASFTSTGIDDNATSNAITIDSSQNIGIGVTPESWDTTGNQQNLQINASSFYAEGDSGNAIQHNSYIATSGIEKYIVNGYASKHVQQTGSHVFRVAPSGTAGNAITWTTPMTVTNTGNVGMGGNLDVDGVLTVSGHTGSAPSVFEASGNGDAVQLQLKVKANNGTTSTHGLYGNAGNTSADNNLCLGVDSSTGLTINSSGNVGIGVTPKSDWYSNATALQISPTASLYNTSNWEDFSIANNAYYNSSAVESYIQNDAACKIRLTDVGMMDFRVAPSGTAGNAISWTTAMAITSTGNVELGGNLDMADNVLQKPELKDYAETVNAIGSVGGGTQDINLELGNVVTATVDTSTTTFTFSGMPATGKGGAFTLILTNGASQTVNFPLTVDWAAGTAPTLTTAGVDVLTFTTVDGGTIWYGIASGLAMA